MSRRGLAFMLISGLNFALMALMVAVAHRLQPELSTVLISLIRALVNLILLIVFAWPTPGKLWGDGRAALWARGVFGSVALLSYFAALARISVGEAAFLNQSSAFWVAVLAPLVFHEKSNRWNYVALLGAIVGMGLLSYPRSDVAVDVTGRLLGAGSGVLAAIAYLSVRQAGETNPPSTIVFYFSIVSTAITACMLPFEHGVAPASPLIWLVLVSIGVFATLGQLYMTRAYAIGPTVTVAVTAYASPLFSSLLGVLFLKQRPDAMGWLGMGLILACGIALPAIKWHPRPA